MFYTVCHDQYGNPITRLTQWDMNQTLYIDDHNFTTPPLFHYSNKNTQKAIVVQSTLNEDGSLCVKIPNQLLIEPYPITIYVYLVDNTTDDDDIAIKGKTVEVISLPVTPRQQPDDFIYEENIKIISLMELTAEVKEINSAIVAAEETRISNENLREKNEEIRSLNERNRKSAEEERSSTENQRIEREDGRIEAEHNRDNAETLRALTEADRVGAESNRQNCEINRENAETARMLSETARENAESSRNASESLRDAAESSRDTAENERSANEITRQNSENERNSAEALRQANEETRQAQEQARETNTLTAITSADAATSRANTAAMACEGIIEGTGLIPSTEKGAANGVATLDENRKIPNEQLNAKQFGESGVRNLIPYPYHQSSVENNGITFTDNGDGSITINGTAIAETTFLFRTRIAGSDVLPLTISSGQTYILSGRNINESSNDIYLQMGGNDENGNWVTLGEDRGAGAIITPTVDTQVSILAIVNPDAEFNNFVISPMLEFGSLAHDFVPYHFGGAENALTLNGLKAGDFQKTLAVDASTNTLANLNTLVPNSGKVRFIYTSGVPSDFPTNLGTPATFGFLSVEINKVGDLAYYNINAVHENGIPFNITGYYINGTFYWNNNADGGNAATLEGHPASDFVIRSYETMNGIDLLASAENNTICPVSCSTRFRAFEPTNAPTTNGDFFIEVLKVNNEYINVIATSNKDCKLYINAKVGNVWQGWRRYVLSGNISNRWVLNEPLTIDTGGNWDNINIVDENDVYTRIRCGSVPGDRAQVDITVSEDNTDNNRIGLRLQRNLKNTDVRDDALTLFNVINGADVGYTVLHTGNSTRVVVSSTAPADTSALWIS